MDVNNKKVTVIGMGVSGKAASMLLKEKGASVCCMDSCSDKAVLTTASELDKSGISTSTGGYDKAFIEESCLVVASPGVKDSSELFDITSKNSIRVISEIELGFRFCKSPVIAVTGTNGKSTAVTLIGRMLEASGIEAAACGNIGDAFSGKVSALEKSQRVVLEVSSFQLKRADKFKPNISLIMNISQNHFDWHPDFSDYFRAKMNIYKNQDSDDFCVLNYDDKRVRALSDKPDAKVYFYSIKDKVEGAYLKEDKIVLNIGEEEQAVSSLDDIKIPGSHNISNAVACCLCSYLAGASPEGIRKALKEFKGLGHRIQCIAVLDGVRYVDDSKATTVDACRAALKAHKGDVILIAGGRDKGSDFSVIREDMERKVKTLVLLGEAKHKIRESLKSAVDILEASSMREAVESARSVAEENDTVLLSPMCSSFDMYSDYKQRGKAFQGAVNELRNTKQVRKVQGQFMSS